MSETPETKPTPPAPTPPTAEQLPADDRKKRVGETGEQFRKRLGIKEPPVPGAEPPATVPPDEAEEPQRSHRAKR